MQKSAMKNFSSLPEHMTSHLSQQHRMVEVGGGLGRSFGATPCSSGATTCRFPTTMSRQLLRVSRDGDSTTSLSNLYQCSQGKGVS